MQYTLSEIQALHKKYAPSDEVYDLVFIHCQIIHDIAEQLIAKNGLNVDTELVRIGCLLHDIGVHPLFGEDGKLRPGVNYITHGTEGEAILKAEGFPEAIWRFCSHHTGVGLSKQDIVTQELPLPAADYLADTDEELLIMYADKFHSKTTPPYFNSFEWYRQDIARFGSDKVRKFEEMAEKFGVPDLKPLAEKFGYEIRDYSPADTAPVK
jgi:uncharacterized protein